jgi:tRNA1Val (adenine37-N6)-methyltransferase
MLYTEDRLFNGQMICRQHRKGYRFSVDAVLLAHFCRPKPRARVLDLGCGCGVIGLILCHRFTEVQVMGLELQPGLAALAHSNVLANALQARFTVQQADLRTIHEAVAPESFDLVLSNPPYYSPQQGRISQGTELALARHELSASLEELLAASAFAVKNRGVFCCIYPAERLDKMLHLLRQQRLSPKRLQPVYSYPGASRARLVLLEAIKNGGEGLHLLPPLYVYQEKNGPYSSELACMYAGSNAS